jgi:enoyl-CoA hydratase
MTAAPVVSLRCEGPVATLTLNRPHRRNAMDSQGWLQLAAWCGELAQRDDIRVVVLKGEGDHFCAGADIRELASAVGDTNALREQADVTARGLDTIATLPQPTVAMLRGNVYGGGAALAVSCDFRFADSTVEMAITPARLGLAYRLIDCRRLRDVVGMPRARQMLLQSRVVSASELVDWQLAQAVHPAAELQAAVDAYVATLLALSGHSQRAIKATLNAIAAGQRQDDHVTRSRFAEAFQGADFKTAAAAFVARKT